MRALIFAVSVLAIIVGAATVSGCQSYRTDARGQRYHVGDEWITYRFDRNFNPHLVR